VLVGVMGVGVYLAVALLTVVPLGMPGLALANAAQNSAHAVVLYALLARRHPSLLGPRQVGFVIRIALGGAVAALLVGLAGADLRTSPGSTGRPSAWPSGSR